MTPTWIASDLRLKIQNLPKNNKDHSEKYNGIVQYSQLFLQQVAAYTKG